VQVVGSRAGGTAGPLSDFDYIIVGGNSKIRAAARRELPRGISGGELQLQGWSGIDVFNGAKKGRLEPKANQSLFHGAWSFRREALDRVFGYTFIQSGQDQGLLKRFKSANLRRADPIQFDPRPSYVYRWFTAHSLHISAMGADGYDRLAGSRTRRPRPSRPAWKGTGMICIIRLNRRSPSATYQAEIRLGQLSGVPRGIDYQMKTW